MANDQDPISGRQRRVTMEEVGRMAGVSQVTVSRALSDPSKVSPATLARIQKAIDATGFVRNAVAGTLASRKSRLISALVPSIVNPIYSSMIRVFSERIRPHGYQILLSETGFDEAEEEAAILAHLSRQPDAILLTGIQHSSRARRLLLGAGIPVIELWDVTDSPVDLCVGFHHAGAARAAGEFALARGYRRAGTVTASDARARRRQKAFADVFSRATDEEVQDVDVGGPATIGAGRKAMSRLARKGDIRGSVIFASSDILAHGILIEARALELKIPEDIGIIGFGDQEFARDLDPPLTTVRIDLDRLGAVAAETLLGRIAGNPVASAVTDLGFEIVRRGSA